MPDVEPEVAAEVDRAAVAFTRLLRGAGIDVPIGSTVAFGEALGVVGFERRDALYWAGRATLVKRPEDIDTYDRVFAAFWREAQLSARTPPLPPTVATVAFDSGDAAEADEEGGEISDAPVIAVRWSPAEVLRQRDFAVYTPSEFDEARRLMADLRLVSAMRPSRRRRPARRPHGPPDVRRTVRDSLRYGGEPIRRAFFATSETPRRLVLLLDVSGSMEPYARAFVRFLHAAVVSRRHVEAFALGTRLTRITRELSSRDPDAAIRAAAARVADWSGGTRLGDGLRAFNDGWGVPGMARGAVVVIVSDGWDRGDAAVLGEQMERLARVAHRIVWVNPLKASPGYAPLARGMAAALPFVDEFVEGHSLAALEQVADAIGHERRSR
ncbi:MAG: uncharacterized protein QOI55_933 [Actinomycetota bacterium]|nr:uncharacterized protein [Actinomycetota bacterium]